MQGDLAPFGGAIDYEDYVANFRGLESGAGDARFFDEKNDVEEGGEIEAAADAAEIANFVGELLLGFDPGAVGGGGERGDALMA
jgi:hypothetical protein